MPRVHVDAPLDADLVDVARAVAGPWTLIKASPTGAARNPFKRWRALADIHDRIRAMYAAHVKRMVAAIRTAIESTHGRSLKKAGPSPLPLLTPEQLREITEIIQRYHTGFAIRIGAESASQAEIDALLQGGFLPSEAIDMIGDTYRYGQVVGGLRQFDDAKKAKSFSYEEFKKRIERRPVATSAHDKAAIDWSRHSVAVHCKGLGNKIADDVSTTFIDADAELRRKYVATIRTATEANIERHETWRRLASDLGHETEDWTRDMMRIAATEKQAAFQEGFSQSLIEREGDPDLIFVVKLPRPDACPDCIRLHLTEGAGSPPRMFRLDQLHENGTNVGKKRGDWLATVGPVHPWCACELSHVPPGWAFPKKPEGEQWERVPGKKNSWRDRETGEPWVPDLEPALERSEAAFRRDLRKSIMRYINVPDEGVAIRVGDPLVREQIELVIARTPKEILTRRTGVTLITTDTPRVGSELSYGDLAYWTGNEIRLSQTLPPERVSEVLEHEFGHAPNIFLLHRFGSDDAVRAWHDRLYEISRQERFVSKYAEKHPIENSAEVTRLYLYERARLKRAFPRQFGFVHADYRDLIHS